MPNKKKENPSLSDLVKRFSKFDVIAEMEKEYQASASKSLPLSLIDDNSCVKRCRLPRQTLESLGNSIAKKGIFSPLLVRKKRSHYEVVLGRKRYFGAKAAHLSYVPVIIADIGDEEMLLTLLADTRDSRQSNILEMAYIYEALMSKFQYSPQTLAQLSHLSRSQVVNTVRLLNLPDPIIREVSLGELSYGHARALLPLSQELIMEASKEIHARKLSVRETEDFVRYLSLDEKKASPEAEATYQKGERKLTLSFESDHERDLFLSWLKKNKKLQEK